MALEGWSSEQLEAASDHLPPPLWEQGARLDDWTVQGYLGEERPLLQKVSLGEGAASR